jgi:D-tyrosyl-tRNA(Tyr) deacylase
VEVGGERVSSIGPGMLVLLGVKRGDTPEQADKLAAKVRALRIFDDAEGRMNLSVEQTGGEVLVVSQFTLYGDTRQGNRPSYDDAAPPDEDEPLYERVRSALEEKGGSFGAHMHVALVNDGPVTVLIET